MTMLSSSTCLKPVAVPIPERNREKAGVTNVIIKMSSIGQSILMAITVTVNKYASSNVQAVHRRSSEAKRRPTKTVTAKVTDFGRRGLLLSSAVAAPQLNDYSTNELLKKYLKKSEDNKAKNDKERLESYYKRNYKDYFGYLEGTLRAKNEQQLSESEKGILEWLQTNK